MLERLLRFSVTNRWLIVLFTAAVAAVGAFSLKRLPIDAVPDITNNQVQINTVFPALSPFEIEKQVTFPVETALAGIPGLQYTWSLSRNGFSQITAVFDDDVDIYFARQQINERLTGARDSLPPGAQPTMGPVATGLGEVFTYAVDYEHRGGKGAAAGATDGQPGWQTDGTYLTPEGKRLDTDLARAAYLREVQDWIIRPQLRNVKDVAGVDSLGGYVKQYHVQPDPTKLISYGLTFGDVIEALEKNNVSTGAGYVEHKGEAYTVRAAGRIEDEGQIGRIAVGTRNGTPIYVRDVAAVGIGKELRTGSASKGGEEVVLGVVMMRVGANSRTVAADANTKLTVVNKSLPPDITAKPVLDRTRLVDATIRTVEKNLAEGAILVTVILFLLLGNIRAALITALAIPLSMFMTAIGMVQGKVSGNLMSLGAVDFGLIVDGAVIIVENCLRVLAERQHQLGRKLTPTERLETVFEASKQVRSATAFGEAIIIIVYIPILALTGVEGKMFRPMAVTVILALVAAFILSLTFIPAMIAIVIRGKVSEKENFLIRGAKAAYGPALRAAVRGRWVTVPLAVLAFVASLWLFTRLGSVFVPTLDEGDINVETVRIPSTGLTQTTMMEFDVERTIKEKVPEVAYVYSKTGTAALAADPMPPNASDTYVILKPRAEWADPRMDKGAVVEKIAKALEDVPGSNYSFSQPIQMRFNELIAGIRADVAVKVFGDTFEEMVPTAEKVAAVLSATPGSADVKVEQTQGLPVMNVEIDRDAIARYGLTMANVQDVVAAAVGGRAAGLVFEGDRRFDLVVRLPDVVRQQMDRLKSLPVPLPQGENNRPPVAVVSATRSGAAVAGGGGAAAAGPPPFVPLSAIARIRIAEGPNQISRENGKRRVVVQANVRGRDIGSFVEEAQRRIDEQVKLPAGTWLAWGGQFENLLAARQRLLVVVPVCFFLIFILLFGSFGSVKYAVMVFMCVPLALTGGIVALWLRDMPFSISAAVGFIALSGVAVLNGLVMITFINQLRQQGEGIDHAILHGSMTRLRPVLMTSLVASLGFVPMALATGTGAEVQKPLATVVIGGLISATFLTLFVLPSLYRIIHAVPKASADAPKREAAPEAAAASH